VKSILTDVVVFQQEAEVSATLLDMSSKTKPRFSVVIPCFNEANYIEKTLRSVAEQDFKGDVEVIVVDNNCTDSTAEIAKRLGAKVVFESTPGVCSARQRGTEEAKGEIIVSTDADTVFANNWLSSIDRQFNKKKSTIAVAGPCRFVDGPLWADIYPFLLFGFISFVYKFTRRTYYGSATNISFKKSAWDGYDTNLTQGGDELGLLESLRKKGHVAFDNKHPTYTSTRRLTRGLLYNFFVTLLYYYFLAYYLNKWFGRQIIGSGPAYRTEKPDSIRKQLSGKLHTLSAQLKSFID
jgi:glycosyltransferase involved in cell wall biosynthesis